MQLFIFTSQVLYKVRGITRNLCILNSTYNIVLVPQVHLIALLGLIRVVKVVNQVKMLLV